MSFLGKQHTLETRRKMSIAQSKENHPMWGKKHLKESIQKMSLSTRGENHPFYGKFGEESSFWGKKFSEGSKKKISIKLKGRKFTKEHKEKLRIVNQGENNPNWQGGISFEPYPIYWTEALKKSIRIRDRYTCQICQCKWKKGQRRFDVHHIDRDKDNCDPKNLITLCRICHNKL